MPLSQQSIKQMADEVFAHIFNKTLNSLWPDNAAYSRQAVASQARCVFEGMMMAVYHPQPDVDEDDMRPTNSSSDYNANALIEGAEPTPLDPRD